MDRPDPHERVLAQPTRRLIFDLLVEAKEPLRTDSVAGRLGMHVNGIRRHLEQLAEAGLIDRRRERGRRGRPGDSWVIASDATPGGMKPTAYTELAVWLAEAMPTDPESIRRVEEVGRRIGRRLRAVHAPDSREPAAEAFRDVFAALGFQPEITQSEGGGFSCTLRNCPYMESAAANPEAVCGLHRGMTAGLLERLDEQSELSAFIAHDPREAGCLVTVA